MIAAEVDEVPLRAELPTIYAQRVAKEKAEKIAANHPDKLILAADTVVALGRRILPKAEDEATARKCLELLSGRRHRAYTAVHLISPKGAHVRLIETHVSFKRLSDTEMDMYLASGEWQGKAGGYAIQGIAGAFIPRINGSYTNVVGLPLTETLALLRNYRAS